MIDMPRRGLFVACWWAALTGVCAAMFALQWMLIVGDVAARDWWWLALRMVAVVVWGDWTCASWRRWRAAARPVARPRPKAWTEDRL